MHTLLEQLKGGDRRSIGASQTVVRQVLDDPRLFPVLVQGLDASDALVKMRSADALEKITAENPGLLQRHSRRILRHLNADEPCEVLWHMLQLAPRIRWGNSRISGVLQRSEQCLQHESRIVRTFALQALVSLLPQKPEQKQHVEALLRSALRKGSPAVRSRARKLLAELAG